MGGCCCRRALTPITQACCLLLLLLLGAATYNDGLRLGRRRLLLDLRQQQERLDATDGSDGLCR